MQTFREFCAPLLPLFKNGSPDADEIILSGIEKGEIKITYQSLMPSSLQYNAKLLNDLFTITGESNLEAVLLLIQIFYVIKNWDPSHWFTLWSNKIQLAELSGNSTLEESLKDDSLFRKELEIWLDFEL